ncbi:hypothetical protein CYMTET_26296, partial [Cymbomonas tetramitiformis]
MTATGSSILYQVTERLREHKLSCLGAVQVFKVEESDDCASRDLRTLCLVEPANSRASGTSNAKVELVKVNLHLGGLEKRTRSLSRSTSRSDRSSSNWGAITRQWPLHTVQSVFVYQQEVQDGSIPVSSSFQMSFEGNRKAYRYCCPTPFELHEFLQLFLRMCVFTTSRMPQNNVATVFADTFPCPVAGPVHGTLAGLPDSTEHGLANRNGTAQFVEFDLPEDMREDLPAILAEQQEAFEQLRQEQAAVQPAQNTQNTRSASESAPPSRVSPSPRVEAASPAGPGPEVPDTGVDPEPELRAGI